ncbi:MAG TPA: DsbA family protein, partial [Rhodospirillales bacterium]|nr:DsbA family protein [Rhodospirillales bacterium]
MPRFVLGIAFVLIASLSGPAFGATAPLEDALSEKVMGNPNAPVTIIEYASLSCSHCKAFHRDSLPKIKKEYIDTGKVKLIYRDFPLGSLALAGSMLARCAGTLKFFGMVDALFKAQ